MYCTLPPKTVLCTTFSAKYLQFSPGYTRTPKYSWYIPLVVKNLQRTFGDRALELLCLCQSPPTTGTGTGTTRTKRIARSFFSFRPPFPSTPTVPLRTIRTDHRSITQSSTYPPPSFPPVQTTINNPTSQRGLLSDQDTHSRGAFPQSPPLSLPTQQPRTSPSFHFTYIHPPRHPPTILSASNSPAHQSVHCANSMTSERPH